MKHSKKNCLSKNILVKVHDDSCIVKICDFEYKKRREYTNSSKYFLQEINDLSLKLLRFGKYNIIQYDMI